MNRASTTAILRGIVWVIYAALAAGILWGVASLVTPEWSRCTFFQSVIDGLRLGFVYALIALWATPWCMASCKSDQLCPRRCLYGRRLCQLFRRHTIRLGLCPGHFICHGSCARSLNIVIERVAYKPLRNAPRIAALITAIGVSFFLEYFTALKFVFGADYNTYQRPFEGQDLGCRRGADLEHYRHHRGNHRVLVGDVAIHHQPHQGRQSDARHVAGQARSAVDGHQRGRHHIADLRRRAPHWPGRVGCCMPSLFPQIWTFMGDHARPQGLCGGRAGRASAVFPAPLWARC